MKIYKFAENDSEIKHLVMASNSDEAKNFLFKMLTDSNKKYHPYDNFTLKKIKELQINSDEIIEIFFNEGDTIAQTKQEWEMIYGKILKPIYLCKEIPEWV